jgi:hypothetical protein
MEKSNILKQAKSDIFKELYTIISFYIKRGAKAKHLKKYYKNNKRLTDLIEDIKYKAVNLVSDEDEYRKLVRSVINEILDDIIYSEKDKKSKMKHIKEFNSWVTDSSGDYDINYGDKKDISDFVEDIKDYMEDNFKRIRGIETIKEKGIFSKHISYMDNDLPYTEIVLRDIDESGFYTILLKKSYTITKELDLTKDDYIYLLDFVNDTNRRFRKDKQNRILNKIRPELYKTKNYNL